MLTSSGKTKQILYIVPAWSPCLRGEEHLVFEGPTLQDFRGRYDNLFQAPQGDAMILFMWQY